MIKNLVVGLSFSRWQEICHPNSFSSLACGMAFLGRPWLSRGGSSIHKIAALVSKDSRLRAAFRFRSRIHFLPTLPRIHCSSAANMESSGNENSTPSNASDVADRPDLLEKGVNAADPKSPEAEPEEKRAMTGFRVRSP